MTTLELVLTIGFCVLSIASFGLLGCYLSLQKSYEEMKRCARINSDGWAEANRFNADLFEYLRTGKSHRFRSFTPNEWPEVIG